MNNDDEPDFAEIIGGVKRLRSDRVNHYPLRNKKPAKAIRSDISDPDLEQSMPLESASAGESYFNHGLQKKVQRKIRQGLLRPEASLDLHGMRQQQATRALTSFLSSAVESGLRIIIIIHGQGYRSQSEAVLKPMVHRWLAGQQAVLAWCPAQPRDGAAGASYVYLRAG